MKPFLAVLVTAAGALAGPAAAAGPTLTVSQAKPCYGTGDQVSFRGSGFTPGAVLIFTRDGERINAKPPIRADPVDTPEPGALRAMIRVFNRSGQERRTYAATERANRANTASTQIMVSELDVDMSPTVGPPGALRRITAVGFTTGSTLWAHIVFKGKVRNVKIGALKGPCGELTERRRLFAASPPFGVRRIYFDTSPSYEPRVAQRVPWRFTVSPK